MFNETLLTDALAGTPLSVFLFSSIDSTNSEAKRHAMRGGASPALFLAEEQTAGRGRMGRSFFSPKSTGIYLSILFPTDDALSDPVTATTASAVAARRAILQITGLELGIKWVNDLYLKGKKVCGILAESFFVGQERFLIVGVGVNLSTTEFPEELLGKAGSLFSEETNLRDTLAVELAKQLLSLLCNPRDFMDEYRAASIVLGKEITYLQNQMDYCGVAESIDDLGRLTVRHKDGTSALLASGEISLRIYDDKGATK